MELRTWRANQKAVKMDWSGAAELSPCKDAEGAW